MKRRMKRMLPQKVMRDFGVDEGNDDEDDEEGW